MTMATTTPDAIATTAATPCEPTENDSSLDRATSLRQEYRAITGRLGITHVDLLPLATMWAGARCAAAIVKTGQLEPEPDWKGLQSDWHEN